MTTAASPGFGEHDPESLGEHVELSLPARPDLLFLARMTAAAVASRADFGYDQIEDLRLAIDELVLTLLAAHADDSLRVELRFGWRGDSIEVAATLEDYAVSGRRAPAKSTAGSAGGEFSEFSERILDALVDEHGFEDRSGKANSWLRMRRRETAG